MRSRILASILLTPAFLAACADPEKERQPLPDSRPYAEAVRQAEKDWVWIAGTEWVLVSIEGQPPLDGTRSTLSFKPDETWMFGSTGCNRFTGSYIRRGVDGVEVGPLAVTKMFCSQPEGVMQQEARLLHLLDMADSYTASRDRFSLEVDGSTVLVYYASPKP